MRGKPLYPWALTAVAGILLMIVLSFVGLHQTPTEEAADAGHEEQQTADAGDGGVDVSSCIGCHGPNLEGASGPNLMETTLSHEEIVNTIINGATGMPPGLATPEQAEAIATYLLEN